MSADYDAEVVVKAGPQKPGKLPRCAACGREWHGMRHWDCEGSFASPAPAAQIDTERFSDPETSVGPIPTYETRQRAAQPDLADSYQYILDHAHRAIRHLLGFAWAGLDDNQENP